MAVEIRPVTTRRERDTFIKLPWRLYRDEPDWIGRLLPFGWITALREKRNIDAVRVFALGVKPAYQHTGVAARFFQMHFDAAERTPQKGGEMGWILETNQQMNRAMEGMGGEIKRRYRVYERAL